MKKLIVPLLMLALLAACSDSSSDGGGSRAQGPATVAPTSPPAASSAATAAGAPAGRVARPARQFDPDAVTLAPERVVDGLRRPLYVTAAPDGSGRLFVVEQPGAIRIVANGRALPQPFLDVSSLITSQGNEQGLLGLVFHPRYRENGTFFINYTARDGDNTVARYRVSSDPNRADPDSGSIVLAIEDFASNHNAGMLAFGLDGYLYVGTGDGGQGNDPRRNGQNREALLAKMLRLDVDSAEPYAVPRDNPFVGQSGARPEVWAYGLRNPWRYSFDRATGDLWIADVGQNAFEEINVQPAGSRGGENYGWSRMEGAHCLPIGSQCEQNGLVLPVTEYGRDLGVSVTGGYVYRGTAYPALEGAYIFGDYGSGRIWSLHQGGDGAWVRTELLDTDFLISSFGEDEAGEMYLTDHQRGVLYQVTVR